MLLKKPTLDHSNQTVSAVVELQIIPRACKSKCEKFPRIKNTTLQDSPWPDPPPRVDQVIRGAQGNKIQTHFPQQVLHPMPTIPYYYVLYSSVRLSISCSVSWLSAQCDRDAITFEAASFIDLMIIVSSVPKVIKVCTKSDHNLNQKWPNCTVLTLSCRSRDTFTSIYRKTTSVYKHDTNQGTSTAGARSRRAPINPQWDHLSDTLSSPSCWALPCNLQRLLKISNLCLLLFYFLAFLDVSASLAPTLWR